MTSIHTKLYGWESDKTIVIIATIRQIFRSGKQRAATLPTTAARKEFLSRNKIIIISEFLAALDILEIGIRTDFGIRPLRLDGQTSVERRQQVCDQFEETGKDFATQSNFPNDRTILLATRKVVSEGLALGHASHIMFLAPTVIL